MLKVAPCTLGCTVVSSKFLGLMVTTIAYDRPFSKMAPAERGLETGGISFQYGGKHGEKCATEWKLRARYFRVCE